MNYSADQVLNGLIGYADHEVMDKLPISGKWVIGTAIGVSTKKASNIIEALRENAIVNMLGIFDDEGMIDVDTIIEAMKSSAERYGKLTVEVPLVGKMTFSVDDIDRLKTYIE